MDFFMSIISDAINAGNTRKKIHNSGDFTHFIIMEAIAKNKATQQITVKAIDQPFSAVIFLLFFLHSGQHATPNDSLYASSAKVRGK